jgi:hypothetical protein
MGRVLRLGLVAMLFAAVGCAHSITITPDIGSISASGINRIDKNVGYYISPEDLALQVVTPAGGGDKVKYFPYKESEPALKQLLSNVFREVHPLKSPGDAAFIASKNISYVFIPVITTDSSSRSSWIWPPSDFTVTLRCRATDAAGGAVWETTVAGEAHMRLPDVSRDHSLAGKEAVKNAFSELQGKILSAEAFR